MLHVMTSSKAVTAQELGEGDLKTAAAAMDAKAVDPPPVAAPRKKVDPARKAGAQEPRRRVAAKAAPQHDESCDFE